MEKSLENRLVLFSIIILLVNILVFFLFFIEFPYATYISVPIYLVFFIYCFKEINLKKYLIKEKLFFIAIILFFFFFSVINFSYYRLEGGHDNGVYTESAILYSNQNKFYSSNPLIATYPGFMALDNKTIVSGFLPAYSLYLSSYYRYFGLVGIIVGNFILLVLAFSFLFLCMNKIGSKTFSFIFMILFIFSYYTIYFSQSTYSEHLQLFLIWFSFFLIIKGIKYNSINSVILASIPLGYNLLNRTESLISIILYIIFLIFFIIYNKMKCNKINFSKKLIVLVIIINLLIICIFLLYFFMFYPKLLTFYTIFIDILTRKPPIEVLDQNAILNQHIVFLLLFYFSINFFGIFGLFLISIPFIFLSKRFFLVSICILSFIFLPHFLFLYIPGIALYSPWFMRRFFPVIFPFIIIFIANFLDIFRKKISLKYFLFLLFLVFICLTNQTFTLIQEGKEINSLFKEFSTNYQDSTLIFYDKNVYEIFGPNLFFYKNLNVVYDRPPEFQEYFYYSFLANKNNIYLVSSREINEINHIYINNESLIKVGEISKNISYILGNIDLRYTDKKYNSYSELISKFSLQQPTSWVRREIKYNIYQVNPSFIENLNSTKIINLQNIQTN